MLNALRRSVRPPDIALAAGLYAVCLVWGLVEHRSGLPLGLLPAAALLFRRSWPVTSFLLVIATGEVHSYFNGVEGGVALLLFPAYYSLGRYCRSQRLVAAVALLGLATLFADTVVSEGINAADLYLYILLGLYAFGAMLGVLVRRQVHDSAERRATEERLRIARELHDLIGHSVMAINVQAGVAARAVDTDPAAVRRALETIKSVSGNTMDELRATLGLLRGDDTAPPATDQPGVDDIGDLVAGTGCGHAQITYRQDIAPVEVPPLIGLTAYRVVQEALTNIGKHAPDAKEVAVDVRACAKRLQVTVVNDGARRPGRPGHGLTGIRERAAAVGGTVTIGPLPEHRFQVDLMMPIRGRG